MIKLINIIIFSFLFNLFVFSQKQTFNFNDSIISKGQSKSIYFQFYTNPRHDPINKVNPIADSVLYFLNKNNNIVIEIGVYRNFNGHDKTNLMLSEGEAIRVKDFLIEKGIVPNRIIAIGYGNQNPIIIDSILSKQYPYFKIGQKIDSIFIKSLKSEDQINKAIQLCHRTVINILSIKNDEKFNYDDKIFDIGQIKQLNMSYYFNGRGQVHENSYGILDSLCKFLKQNDKIKIEVGVYVGYFGNDKTNYKVTNGRAERVKEYIRSKGINENRVNAVGYGESIPLIVDRDIAKQYPFFKIGTKLDEKFIESLSSFEEQELAKKLNFRTIIKIIN